MSRGLRAEELRSLLVRPKFLPPETYQENVAKQVNPFLDEYTHIIILDTDMEVSPDFFDLPAAYPQADIIAPKIIPRSSLYRAWEIVTYWIRLNRLRIRGSAIIYSTFFLKRVGGYPIVTTPDTWLLKQANKVVQVPLKAYHNESFSIRHSLMSQARAGKARAEMREPVWRVAAHSLVRLRPLVLLTYIYYRAKRN
jgi:hypothetical protein